MSVTVTPHIRVATPADLHKVRECAVAFYTQTAHLPKTFWVEKFVSTWETLIGAEMGIIFMLECGDRVVGGISGIKVQDIYNGDTIASEMFWFVMPEFRGHGMELYKRLENWAIEGECTQLKMARFVDLMSEKLDRVYRRLGYHEVEVHYVKDLKPCAA